MAASMRSGAGGSMAAAKDLFHGHPWEVQGFNVHYYIGQVDTLHLHNLVGM